MSASSLRGGIEAATLFLVAVLSAAVIYSTGKTASAISFEQQNLIPPPNAVKYLTFGYQETFADVFWLRLVQNIEACGDVKIAKDQVCNNSWAFKMLDLITDLAPKFRISYILGATVLSVITHDREGAAKIYLKGIEQYPNDWSLNYRAAYHFMAEVGDRETAAKLFLSAYKDGGPTWIPALVGKLMTESGELEIAERVLIDILSEMPEDENQNRERVELRLKEVQAKLRKVRNS